jgi:glycosyltransferase involved in cell wall biosynthesis
MNELVSPVVSVGPLVSVVIPTRDRVNYLKRAAESVLRQTQTDWELIIVDDASQDGTAAYLSELVGRDNRVRFTRNATARGGAGARNEGILESRGRWIAFLDDDDEWLPEKLQRQLQLMQESNSAVACSCNYVMRFASGRSRLVQLPANVTLEQLLLRNRLGSASLCLCSGVVLKEIGGFDATLKSAQDQDLWVRLRERGTVLVCAAALVLYRSHTGPRITNNMLSQYLGARRFYFKHRGMMSRPGRRRRMAHNCYLMSRQPTRHWRYRLRYLRLSARNSPAQNAFGYATSSLPRLLRDAVFNRASARA